MFLILVLYMVFASTFTIAKAALSYTTPIFLIAVRMLIGGGLLLAYQYWYNYKQWRFRWSDVSILLQVSFFEYYTAFIFECWALQWVSSSKACLIFNLSPFITALISFFLLHERLTRKKMAGLIIGFLGFIPILSATTAYENLAGSLFGFSMPEISLLGAVFCASYGWIILRETQKRGYAIVMINGLTMTTAGFAALLTSFILEGFPTINPPQSCVGATLPLLCSSFGIYGAGIIMFMAYTLALVILAHIIGFNLYGYLLERYSTTFVSFAGFVTPLFAALFGWMFLCEKIGISFFLTMAIVFWGLLLFYQDEL
jgi:drug/metabolite transporter (DMT)-like permease